MLIEIHIGLDPIFALHGREHHMVQGRRAHRFITPSSKG